MLHTKLPGSMMPSSTGCVQSTVYFCVDFFFLLPPAPTPLPAPFAGTFEVFFAAGAFFTWQEHRNVTQLYWHWHSTAFLCFYRSHLKQQRPCTVIFSFSSIISLQHGSVWTTHHLHHHIDKKLRCCEQHSASVVLSWCMVWHLTGDNLQINS